MSAQNADPHIGVSHGPGVFTEEEFQQAAGEVTNPDLSNYEFFVESHGTKIYRHYREVRLPLDRGEGRRKTHPCFQNKTHSSTFFKKLVPKGFCLHQLHSILYRKRVCTSTRFMESWTTWIQRSALRFMSILSTGKSGTRMQWVKK